MKKRHSNWIGLGAVLLWLLLLLWSGGGEGKQLVENERGEQYRQSISVNLVTRASESIVKYQGIVWKSTLDGGRIPMELRYEQIVQDETPVKEPQPQDNLINFAVRVVAIVMIWKFVNRIKGNRTKVREIELLKLLKIQNNQRKLGLVSPFKGSKTIPKEWTCKLNAEALGDIEKITRLSATEICQQIRDKKLTAEKVMRCFCYKALEAHQRYNCLTEQWMNQAIQDAIDADNYYLQTGKTRGPLHGLPISLKDTIDVEGVDSTIGIIKKSFKPAKRDATVVEILKKAGAIPFVKSNVPQIVSFECSNPLFGRTLNPHNENFTSGGSSGEGTLLAVNGSPCGLATDLAGSIRISAHSSGVCGLRPTSGRFPIKGFATQNERGTQAAVPGVIGPMARSVQDLVLITKGIIESKPWNSDFSCVPIPWNELAFQERKPLKVGYFVTDGLIDAAPVCQRAVTETVKLLEKAGHKLIPFTPPSVSNAVEIYIGLITADGGQVTKDSLKWEPKEKFSKRLFQFVEIPTPLKLIFAYILSRTNQQTAANVLTSMKSKSMAEYWALTKRKCEYRELFLENWNKYDLDVLICPVNVLPSFPLDFSGNIALTAYYTMLFSLLDLPCGVVPITQVEKGDVLSEETISQFGWIRRGIFKNYDVDQALGLPVGIQVVGRRFQEEKVLYSMGVIEKLHQENHRKKFFEHEWKCTD